MLNQMEIDIIIPANTFNSGEYNNYYNYVSASAPSWAIYCHKKVATNRYMHLDVLLL
jgi:hypothetical protein